jgi:hypothetical protein
MDEFTEKGEFFGMPGKQSSEPSGIIAPC